MPTRNSVAQLAATAGLDEDEALVTLWDVGLDSLLRTSDVVPPSQLSRARAALGLASKGQLRSIAYWMNRLDLPQTEIEELLRGSRLSVRPGARNLPKGGIAVMRRYDRQGERIVQSDSQRGSRRPFSIAPAFEWRTIGRPRDLSYLDVGALVAIHEQLYDDFRTSDNPIDTPGARSEDLLASACHRPQTAHGSTLKYPSIEMAAAALTHSIVNNHPFWNGNKRTALVAMLVLLDGHGLTPTCADDDLFRFILRVAQHRLVPRDWSDLADREVLQMSEWIKSNTRRVNRGERPVKWHKLRKILAGYGCTCEQAKGVGNRMNISRSVEQRGRLGIGTKLVELRVQVAYGDEGREADQDTLKYIRSELMLDEEHGVDSASFYEGEALTAGDFILKYRTILRRLARL